MENEKVKISPVVYDYLFELITVLYEEEYFGFLDSTKNYVDEIINFMYTIPLQKSKLTKNKRFGKYYCKYKHNSKTSWYIVFDVENDYFIVKFITNNHTSFYATYI
jgi:hypothetical protein